VAFADGSSAQYNFDLHGHCEVEMQTSSLPLAWKSYDSAYAPTGNDLPGSPSWLSIPAAKDLCAMNSKCLALTIDTTSKAQDGSYKIWFKSVSTIVMASGATWRTFLPDRHTLLHGHVAVAGALTVNTSATSTASKNATFRLDLHKFAPQLFPIEYVEFLTLEDGALQVKRHLPGSGALSGTGVLVRA